jgi:hypothetical protein
MALSGQVGVYGDPATRTPVEFASRAACEEALLEQTAKWREQIPEPFAAKCVTPEELQALTE